MLRLGIVIDSAAEVPQAVLDNPHVRLLPVRIGIDEKRYVDERKPAATRDFNARLLDLRTAEVSRSLPPDEVEIRKFLLEQVSTDFDHVFGLFVASTRSPIFKSAFAAASRVITDSMPVRMRAGIKGPLLVECYDSLNLFSGYGVQVLEALRKFEAEPLVANIRTHLQELSRSAYGYMAPSQLDFLLTRARARGDKSVGMLGQAAAKMLGIQPVLRGFQGRTEAVAKVRGVPAVRQHVLNLARRELERGLLAPFVNVSYSGDIADVQAIDEYRALVREAEAKGVQVSLQEMSPTNSVNVGANALSVGFIGQPHEAEL
ncbi:DegV family protein [Variovorax terrae]|uniref:DegV family protein n=1 Tax=Variovorax terrae TaxID=2923278 RepID=A0A9X2API9_9BURK|nr:DegV family protein [Variovorax terrae]MCJ0764945.1 DegV family protein [Variovorax terrae]